MYLPLILCASLQSSLAYLVKLKKVDYSEKLDFALQLNTNYSFPSSDDYFDWREHGKVTPVKDQKGCSACWAFGVIGTLESAMCIVHGECGILSEQMLIDCVGTNDGCNYGSPLKAYQALTYQLGGAVLEKHYPYLGHKGRCRFNETKQDLVPVILPQTVEPDEEKIKWAVRYGYPVTAAINSASMKNYGQNNYIDEPSEEKCGSHPNEMDHTVVIVGYSSYVNKKTGKTTPYWIIKNSWGEDWGDKGFYYLIRGKNACGIANDVSFASVRAK